MRASGWWVAGAAVAVAVTFSNVSMAADPATPAFPLSPFSLDHPANPSPAPDFTLPNRDGQQIHLRSLQPRIVVINFWATWCIPCVAELPELKALADDLRGPGFTLLAVDVEESPARVAAFLKKTGIDLPVLYDEKGNVHRDYAVRGLPTTVVIDGEGRLIGRALGSRQWHSPASLAYFRKLVGAQHNEDRTAFLR